MAACNNFVPSVWKKDQICCDCFKTKEEHSTSGIKCSTHAESQLPPAYEQSTIQASPQLMNIVDTQEHTGANDRGQSANSTPSPFARKTSLLQRNRTLLVPTDTPVANPRQTLTDQVTSSPSTVSEKETQSKTDVAQLIPCRYGMACYRQNPLHFEKYSHPPGFTHHQKSSQVPQLQQQLDVNATIIADLQQQLKDHKEKQNQENTQLQQELKRREKIIEQRFQESITNLQNKTEYYEKEIEKLRADKLKMAIHTQGLEKALTLELEEREKRELEKKRILAIRRDTPSYWGPNAFVTPYREVKIPSSSPEFNIVSHLMNSNIERHDNNFGTIYGKDPTEFIVTRVIRIQNDKLWHEYCFKKESIIQKNDGKIRDLACSKYLQTYPMATPLLDSLSNEYWLFHGCAEKTLYDLSHNGYDPRVSSLDGMFGGGFYLAENSSKSNQYIMCPGCKKNSIFTGSGCLCKNQENLEFMMVLYRAVLGDVHIAAKYQASTYRGEGARKVRRAPLKDNNIDIYDSVLGEKQTLGGNKLRYREVILYEPGQAYPEYLIVYKRSANRAHAPTDAERALQKCYYFLKNTFRKMPD